MTIDYDSLWKVKKAYDHNRLCMMTDFDSLENVKKTVIVLTKDNEFFGKVKSRWPWWPLQANRHDSLGDKENCGSLGQKTLKSLKNKEADDHDCLYTTKDSDSLWKVKEQMTIIVSVRKKTMIVFEK